MWIHLLEFSRMNLGFMFGECRLRVCGTDIWLRSYLGIWVFRSLI